MKTQEDWDAYVAWQTGQTGKVHEVGPPEPGPKWWTYIIAVVWFLGMCAGIAWVFVQAPILGAALAGVFWCQCRESS